MDSQKIIIGVRVNLNKEHRKRLFKEFIQTLGVLLAICMAFIGVFVVLLSGLN
jgi:hypothetical protein